MALGAGVEEYGVDVWGGLHYSVNLISLSQEVSGIDKIGKI